MYKYIICFVLSALFFTGCSKPESKEISSEIVFDKVAEAVSFQNEDKADLTEIKNSQRYGIAVDNIKDGFAAFDESGNNADNLIILRVVDDKEVDRVEEAILSYINDISAVWEDNEEENKKIEKRIFKTVDKFVMLYIGNEPQKAEEAFEGIVKETD